jgi:hypothetical protein
LALGVVVLSASTGLRSAQASWPRHLCGTNYFVSQILPLPSLVPDGAGGVYVIGEMDTYEGHVCPAVHLDAAGDNAQSWPTSGALTPPPFHWAVSDAHGGVIAVWTEAAATPHLVGMRWGSDGAVHPSWPVDPVAISDAAPDPSVVILASDTQGGAFVAWVIDSSDLRIQHLQANGGVEVSGGAPLCALSGIRSLDAMVPDGSGGAVVAWTDGRDRGTTGNDVYAQRVDATLTPEWASNGLAVCAHADAQQNAALASDGAGGAFVTWEDDRATPGTFEVFDQRITSAGSIAAGWPADGHRVSVGASSRSPRLVPDGAGGAYAAWTRGSGLPPCVQHIGPDTALVAGWPAGGRAIGSTAALQMALDGIVVDGSGGAYVFWREMPAATWIEREVRLAPSAFAPGWGDTGTVITTGIFNLYARGEGLQPDDQGGVFFLWSTAFGGVTNRSYDRNVIRMSPDGTVGVQLSLVKSSVSAHSVSLQWYAEAGSIQSAALERNTGADWSEVAILLPDGSGNLDYVDLDVVSGHRYGYRLRYLEEARVAYTAETWVDVPWSLLMLRGARPNPAGPNFSIDLSLDDPPGAATLEIFDLQGRRKWRRDVSSLGPGDHLLAIHSLLAPGIYLARLTGLSGARVTPFIVVR